MEPVTSNPVESWRKVAGWTKKYLARYLGTDEETLDLLENGYVQPDDFLEERINMVTGISPEEMADWLSIKRGYRCGIAAYSACNRAKIERARLG